MEPAVFFFLCVAPPEYAGEVPLRCCSHSPLILWRLSMPAPTRRRFLARSAATVTTLSALTAAGAAQKPNDRIVLAVMGVKGRGLGHLKGFSGFPDVEIAYICDP